MSHVVTCKAGISNHAALRRAAQALNFDIVGMPTTEHSLYSGNFQGLGVQLPGWRYPVVCTATGDVKYDNYGGHWGKIEQLDKLFSGYALEVAKEKAENEGWLTEQVEEGDEIVLTLTKYGS